MIAVLTGSVGVSHQVEPMPSPTLSVLRRRQQVIHHFGEGIGGLVLQKIFDLGGRRRQPGQIIGGPANQAAFVRGGRQRQTLGSQLIREERIDRLLDRAGIFRHLRFLNRLQRPPLLRVDESHAAEPRFVGFGHNDAGIFRSLFHPLDQRLDFAIRQLSRRRHLQVVVGVAHRLDDETPLWVARHERRTAVASFFPAAFRVEP